MTHPALSLRYKCPTCPSTRAELYASRQVLGFVCVECGEDTQVPRRQKRRRRKKPDPPKPVTLEDLEAERREKERERVLALKRRRT
jgi:predicted RNA-binding Zn-ribbon protein involved in translation (DUF1610 family)